MTSAGLEFRPNFATGPTVFGDALRRFVQSAFWGEGCLVLGAGASVGLVPLWTKLAEDLAANNGLGALHSADLAQPPWTVERILGMLATSAQAGELQRALYVAPAEAATGDSIAAHVAARRQRAARARLRLLADLIIAMAGAGAASMRRFHVLTYNIDVHLEEAISARGVTAVAMTAEGRQEWRPSPAALDRRKRLNACLHARNPWSAERKVPAEVRILHAHGVLPRPGDDERRASGLVMSSSQYHLKDGLPYGSPNLLQLEAFGGLHCLLFGFSFEDDSVRSLLETAAGLDRWSGYRVLPHSTLLQLPLRERFASDGTTKWVPDEGRLAMFRNTLAWLARHHVITIPYADDHQTPLEFVARAHRAIEMLYAPGA